MITIAFKNPKFIKTGTEPEHYPELKNAQGTLMPEIAVAGRSNVGKSSLLNHLFQRKGMVKTSSTPGKTQHINFFTVDDALCMVDVPGYGYASVPLAVKKKWGPMVQTYLEKREQLVCVLFLLDIRRDPNEDDITFLNWVIYQQLPVVMVLTKTDKVKKNEIKARKQEILESLGHPEWPTVLYSVDKSEGRLLLMRAINDMLKEFTPEAAKGEV